MTHRDGQQMSVVMYQLEAFQPLARLQQQLDGAALHKMSMKHLQTKQTFTVASNFQRTQFFKQTEPPAFEPLSILMLVTTYQ